MYFNLFLFLAGCILLVQSESNVTDHLEKSLFSDIAVKKTSTQRQFLSYIRRWLQGNHAEEKKMLKTTIKYLPIYVPVPVYPNMNSPSNRDFYGAHKEEKQKQKDEHQPPLQGSNQFQLPYPYVPNYQAPYGNQLLQFWNGGNPPAYLVQYGQNVAKPQQSEPSTSYYPFNGNGEYSYVGVDKWPSPSHLSTANDSGDGHGDEYDSVVIDNPELITDPDKTGSEDEYLRKRKTRTKKVEQKMDYYL